jgi:hypothetical protein
VLNTQVKILDIEIKERMNKFIFDLLPNDSSHFITIKLGNRILYFNFIKSKGTGAEETIE